MKGKFSKEHEDDVRCDGIDIHYRYRKSYRRTLGICVRPDLSVMVTVPRGTTEQEIKDFVRERGAWITKARRSLEQRPKRPMHTYETGEVHIFFGKQIPAPDKSGAKGFGQMRGRLPHGHLTTCSRTRKNSTPAHFLL